MPVVNGAESSAASRRVTVIGLGNIGAAVIPHVARMSMVARVTVIDPDDYEETNLWSQDILPCEVGRPKAVVQARRLRRINPSIQAQAIVDGVENVPLGMLRSDVILGCLHSKAPRRVVNQAAWRLGIPWVDAGVNAADGLLARVTVYVPGDDVPCLECAWDSGDYERLQLLHPCGGGRAEVAPTNATSSLGALAAALQAIECRKLLVGDWDHVAAGRQVMIDAQSHVQCVTSLRRRAGCRFDHETWRIGTAEVNPSDITLDQVLERASRRLGGGPVRVGLEGRPFVRQLQCVACGKARATLRLADRLRPKEATCAECGGRTVPVGFETTDWIGRHAVDRRFLRWPLSRIGVQRGDVLTFRGASGRVTHEEIGVDRL